MNFHKVFKCHNLTKSLIFDMMYSSVERKVKMTYGLIIKRPKKENYGFPMSLKQIDYLTTTYSLKQLYDKLKTANIIVGLEDNLDIFSIGEKKSNKWLERKKLPLITNIEVLTFPINQITNEHIQYLANNLNYLKDKNYTTKPMKDLIKSLKMGQQAFIKAFQMLDYEDERYIRYLLAKNFDLKEFTN